MKAEKRFSKPLKFIFSYAIVIVLLLMCLRLLQDRSWFLGFFFLITSGLIVYIYSISKKVPGKYLLPGVILLCLFQIYPAFYSGVVAFTNDSNGHQLSKEQAIQAIVQDAIVPLDNAQQISYLPVIETSSKKLFLVFEYPQGNYWAGNSDQVESLDSGALKFRADGTIENVQGFKILGPTESATYSDQLQNENIRLKDGKIFQPQDLQYLEIFTSPYTYSATQDLLTNTQTGETFRPNGNGQMANSKGETLYPGWKANIGWRNFTSILHNQDIRKPLGAVLAWTFINAFLVVFISFLVGLSLAIIFNSPLLRTRRFYRTIFIIPMAIPSVLSFLVWAGLFGTGTGVIDRLFHISTPWLTDPFWARVAVLIVELWITFPYMFLITTGAIQAIPDSIIEAAEIDGASPFKSFRLIRLPLVLRTVAPLLVASIAMALNNFGAIYLLTGGGPTFPNTNGNAGATDILISYTYKLAFNSQEGNNYGLASALSILNFILVGCISIYGLKRMKTMEGIN